ncbi:MAG: Gfo/Idh/MocA family oxidoreductase [Anaerolineales bacterium]|nr:Gfo/Idh/MocA family oxidoreductase [Anaerolineales bacterium]
MIDKVPIYRAGIIGCGSIASTIEDSIRNAPGFGLLPYTHAGAYKNHPQAQLAAAADIDPEKLDAFGSRWGVSSLYSDYREMLDSEKLDIVSIAAPTHLHYEMTMEAVKRQVKGIFLEKPIARTLKEADEMITACRSARVKVAVNHTRTYDPYYRAAKKLIDLGEIGELRVIFSTWVEGFSFGGSHLFDLLRFMVGTPVDWVFCHLDDDHTLKDPGGDVYMVFKNGVKAHIHMPFEKTWFPVAEFIGTEGRIHTGGYEPEWWKVEKREGKTIFSRRPFPGRNDGKSGMVTAIEELIQSIETDKEPASRLEAGRMALEIVLALHISGRSGVPVKLPITDTAMIADAMY